MSPDSTSALLLLPPPPAFSVDRVKSAFEPAISDALTRLAGPIKGSTGIATLDIVLAIPDLQSTSCRPIAKVFAQLQQYLTSIYTLVGTVAAARDVELDSPGGIDARVLFLDPSATTESISYQIDVGDLGFGPIFGLHSLATSARQWDHLWYPNIESGKILANSFVQNIQESSRVHSESLLQAVSSSQSWTVPEPLLVPDPTATAAVPHYSVIVGGTRMVEDLVKTDVALMGSAFETDLACEYPESGGG